jgi:hypothetical protein
MLTYAFLPCTVSFELVACANDNNGQGRGHAFGQGHGTGKPVSADKACRGSTWTGNVGTYVSNVYTTVPYSTVIPHYVSRSLLLTQVLNHDTGFLISVGLSASRVQLLLSTPYTSLPTN